LSKYNGQIIEKNLIEGLHDNIDIDISVLNSGEPSINTKLIIKMNPLLNLTNTAEYNRCKKDSDTLSYVCDVSQILEKGIKEYLNLHFIVSGIPTNNVDISLLINSSSNIQSGSQLSKSIKFEIIRRANLEISGSEYTSILIY